MAFEWKLYETDSGNEIIFPKGSRRFVNVDVKPIDNGSIERDIYGNAVFMGDPAFWRNSVNISCNDVSNGPISNIFRGQKLTLESPKEESVPGPTATLNTEAVGGSCYGVDANDVVVGYAEPVERVVSIPGAVSIRYRPIFECIVIDRSGRDTQGRAVAGWTLDLEELAGNEVSLTAATQNLTLNTEIFVYTNLFGETFSEDITSVVQENVDVSFGVSSGDLPGGISFNDGVFSGDFNEDGSFVITVEAVADGYESANINVVFFVEEEILPKLTATETTILRQQFLQDQIILPISDYINENETITYTVSDGSLPGGISIATDGTINGIYNEEGSFVATVQASAAGYDPVYVSVVFIIENESDEKMTRGLTKRLTATQSYSGGQVVDVNISTVTKSSNDFASVQQADNFVRIPANITKVRVYIGLRPSVAQNFTAWAEHYSSTGALKEQYIAITNPVNARISKSSSSIIDVEQGDYFKLVYVSSANSSLIALADHDDGSYLEVEAVAGYSETAEPSVLMGVGYLRRDSDLAIPHANYRDGLVGCSYKQISGNVGALNSSNGQIEVPQECRVIKITMHQTSSGLGSGLRGYRIEKSSNPGVLTAVSLALSSFPGVVSIDCDGDSWVSLKIYQASGSTYVLDSDNADADFYGMVEFYR